MLRSFLNPCPDVDFNPVFHFLSFFLSLYSCCSCAWNILILIIVIAVIAAIAIALGVYFGVYHTDDPELNKHITDSVNDIRDKVTDRFKQQ